MNRIYQVDAFTNEAFKGNPAGVMIVDENYTTEKMQNLAMEMNLSETAFLIPKADRFIIRFFTPTNEVTLCGHATLSSAHIIYELGLKKPDEIILFEAKGGNLTARKNGNMICMNFPIFPIFKQDIHPDFKDIVGFQPIEMYSSSYNWILALASTENEIIKATPDFEKIKSKGLGHLIITAAGEHSDRDFVVRCFAPAYGINEDPVTGSAHCALTPFWNLKTGKTSFNSFQVSKRSGRLRLELHADNVEIQGEAITIFAAELKI